MKKQGALPMALTGAGSGAVGENGSEKQKGELSKKRSYRLNARQAQTLSQRMGQGVAQEMEAKLRQASPEAVGQLRELEAISGYRQAHAAQEEAERDELFRQLYQQGLALQERTPGFDLNQEMKNPQFVKLVHPKVGLDVETAFRVAHFKELEPLLMRYAARQAAGQLAQSVATGQMRPPENGALQGAVQVNEDPRLWSREQREAIRERVRKGERVVL